MRLQRLAGLIIAVPAVAACTSGELETATIDQEAIRDAANGGGTQGFFFIPPTVDTAPPFTGPFVGTYKPTLSVTVHAVDCGGAGMVGGLVTTFTNVQVYPAVETYKLVFNTTNAGLTLGNCYRISPRQNALDLGFIDAMVTSGPAPAGYKRYTPGSNVTIAFRLENQDPDGDGVFNNADNCDNDANPGQEDTDGDGIGNACDNPDSDGDGIEDSVDNCDLAPNPGQEDADLDGTGDACDGCAMDPGKTDPGVCGCGVPDVDTDTDGTLDCLDGCPLDPAKTDPGVCGCGVPDVDTDMDGTLDCQDGCPLDPAKLDPGACGCGVPDTDSDGDTIPDCIDTCPSDPANDADVDGVCAPPDNCPVVPNADQTDTDGDGIGDACEAPCADVGGQTGWWTGDNTASANIGPDGVWTGAAAYAAGVVGPAAFSFAGTSYVEAPFAQSGDFTVTFWAKAYMNQSSSYGLFASGEPTTKATTFQVEWGPGATYRVVAGNSNQLNLALGAASTSTFQHIAVTYSGTTVQTYLNGTPVASGSFTGLNFGVAKVGANRGENLRYKGTVDDVHVWGRALSPAEVAAVHAAGADGVCAPAP